MVGAEGIGMSKGETPTTKRDILNATIFWCGGFIFFFLGYILGHWWSMFRNAFWFAGLASSEFNDLKAIQESINAAQKRWNADHPGSHQTPVYRRRNHRDAGRYGEEAQIWFAVETAQDDSLTTGGTWTHQSLSQPRIWFLQSKAAAFQATRPR
jgi:hypothetical protein